MKVKTTEKPYDGKDMSPDNIQYVTIELEDGTKYDINFKYGELYIRKTGNTLSDSINIVPRASNVISLK